MVRRLVPLCARRRSRRDSHASGDPRGLREGRAVRAELDCGRPRRRRDVHRGMHRARLYAGPAARIRHRGHRHARIPRAVHRTPELRPGGGQPRHETSARPRRRESRAETAPSIELDEADAEIVQEGSVRKVSDEMLFYMASRGVTKDEALRMVVLGTAEVVTKRIPVEYAVEVDRLIELELGGGVG